MSATNDLKQERHRIFARCTSADSFHKLLVAQEAIALGILAAEKRLRDEDVTDKRADLKFHISRLRQYADGLVWSVLHPHAIANLAKNSDTPKTLLGQGESFFHVLESARHYFQQLKVPVFIADITNVIKVGDLVIVTNTESPTVVECKQSLPKPEHLMQGRIGRQISRSMATMEYLREGRGQPFGEKMHLLTVETTHKASRNWPALRTVCRKALRHGYSCLAISEFESLWGCSKVRQPTVIDEICIWHEQRGNSFLGTSLGLIGGMDGRFPPPSVWPIPRKLRFAVLEEDVVVFHAVNVRALEKNNSAGKSIVFDDSGVSGGHSLIVKLQEKEFPLSIRFVYDMVYGFETVESCIEGLFGFADSLLDVDISEFGPLNDSKPNMHIRWQS